MSERLEREIQEILARFDDRGPRRRRPSGARRVLGQLRAWFWGTGWDLSPERLLATAVALIVLAFLLGRFIPRLGAYLAVAAVLLFAASILFSVTGWHRPRSEKRWRGRVIELPPSRGDGFTALLRRLQRWFR